MIFPPLLLLLENSLALAFELLSSIRPSLRPRSLGGERRRTRWS